VTRRGFFTRLEDARGQAMVEFVIVLPIMLFLVFMIAFAGLGFERYLRLSNSSRMAARAAAVAAFEGKTPCEAAQDAVVADRAMEKLAPDVTVECDPVDAQRGELITVTLRHTLPNIPLIGAITGPIEISGRATERLE
jgi:Flp pilus assembly protein TadG